ncbi:MAG: CBS domain-containing protein [Candidatus Eisenbacteria bacterium]|nr:CBS domain-containing protein [Candidatus Eisenbacteria bacterium]
MFGKRIHLFTILGFKVRADLSWIIIVVLIIWSLSTGAFPHYYEGLSTATYIWMGIAGALALFASIVFHELSHSLVARRFDLPMRSITLFLFGGVAEMHKEPPSAKAEFAMAIAGPVASIIVGLGFLGLESWGASLGWPVPVRGVLDYLGIINLILAGFNLLPAFPLDGGRVLRSALWKWKGDIRRATRIASLIGSTFGFVLLFLGIISVLRGSFIGGVWWALIGLFLRHASQQSYKTLVARNALRGESLDRFMKREPVTVAPDATVRDLVEDYVYKYHHKLYPVVQDGSLQGCVTTQDVKGVDKAEWDSVKVADIRHGCSSENSISRGATPDEALMRMRRGNISRLMVVDGDRLIGVVTLKDLLRFISLKLDLEREGAGGELVQDRE